MRRLLLVLLASLAAAPAAHAQSLTVSAPSFPDYVDPALSYTLAGWQVLWVTHTPLLTYAHAEGTAGTQLIPGLAEGLPAISPDGRTYTLTLRRGLRYSNGRAVRARDFEHTIKRVLRVRSGGAPFYWPIRGAERYARRGRGDIPGISTRGRRITIRLDAATPEFVHALAIPFAGLVPSGTPMRNLTRRPPPGVGPFRIASVRSGRSITLRRTRTQIPGVPRPALSTLRWRARGRADVQLESEAPAATSQPLLSTYYFFLNTTTPPFDRPEVRRAVHQGLDKPALMRAFGARTRPACTLLPPEMAGARASEPCPFGDPAAPAPQRAQAIEAIRAAGAAGAAVTVYGNDEPSTKAVTEEYAAQLRALGLNATTRIVDGERYFQTIGRERTKAQTGFSNWFADYPHPANFLFLVDPASTQRTNNQNFSRNADPEIRAALAAGRYEDADRRAVDQAYVIPWAHRDDTTLFGPRVGAACRGTQTLFGVDFTRLCRA